jgi:hypothetical protein
VQAHFVGTVHTAGCQPVKGTQRIKCGIVSAMESPNRELKQAVESRHGGTATHARSVPVHESIRGREVWNGAVQVFDLVDSPSGATRAYAWSYGLPDGERRVIAVLQAGSVIGPREAVRAAMVAAAGMAK